MNIALLPLDDRPYNMTFVKKLAAVAGVYLVLPPRDMLGYFFTPAQPESLSSWLQDLPTNIDAVIIALDMLACGGLLASRSESITETEAITHLATLKLLRERRPELKILAFDTILRTSLSARDIESRRVHRLLHRYTTLAGKIKQVPDSTVVQEYEEVLQALSPDVIERYHNVRQRKHQVNRYALELTASGVIDTLLLLMEDVGPEGERYGVHKEEQQALREQSRKLGIEERVFLHNGTDEGALTLLARLINEKRGQNPSLFIRYSSRDGAHQVPTFEDRPLHENVASFVAAVGARLAETIDEADAVLAVHTPYGEPPDLNAFTDTLLNDIASGMPVALVDTSTNGADLNLMRALGNRIPLDKLWAFAAWNTACNSLGTALPQLCIALSVHGNFEALLLNLSLVIERLLDDYIYESVVRPAVNQLLEKRGLNPWDLGENAEVAQELTVDHMKNEVDEHLNPILDVKFAFTVTLPWPRTFEPAIDVWLRDKGPSRLV